MIFYHVSSFINEGDILKKTTKPLQEWCKETEQCDVSTSHKVQEYYQYLINQNVEEKTGKDAIKWCCEAIFDCVRRVNFPTMPSRIWGVYLLNNFEEARCFLDEYRHISISPEGEKLIPKIFEITDFSEKDVFCFDMNIFTLADYKLRSSLLSNCFDDIVYNDVITLAKQYWSGKLCINFTCEYLTNKDVYIGKKIYEKKEN